MVTVRTRKIEARSGGLSVMNNVGYFAASMIFIWVLMVGYLMYIHSRIERLNKTLSSLRETTEDSAD